MKLIQVTAPELKYAWGDSEAFHEWEIKQLTGLNVEKCVYWYVSGSYEGSGNALLYRDGAWYHKDLGHNSCYGPLDDIDFRQPIQSFTAWLEQATPEFRAEVQPLVDALQNEK